MGLKLHLTKNGNITSIARRRTITSAVFTSVFHTIGSICLMSQPLQLFVIETGASDIYIGLLNSALWLGFPMYLLGMPLMYRMGKKKALLFFAGIIPAVVTLPLMFMPYLWHKDLLPKVLLLSGIFLMILLRSMVDCIGGASWLPLLQDNIPRKAVGKCFAMFGVRAQTASMLTAIILAVFLGKNPIWWQFAVVFMIGEIFYILKVFTFAGLSERPTTEKTIRLNPLSALKAVMGNKSTKVFFFYILFYNIAAFMPNAFLVKFLKETGYSSRLIVAASAMIPVGAILSLKFWGRISDKYGNRSVFAVSHFGMLITLLLWASVGMNEISLFLVFALFVMWSIFQSANGIAQTRQMFNIISPENQGQIIIINLIIAFSLAFSSILGGFLVTMFSKVSGHATGPVNYRILFVFAAFIAIAPNILIKHLAHHTDKSTKEVILLTARTMRSMIGSFVIASPSPNLRLKLKSTEKKQK